MKMKSLTLSGGRFAFRMVYEGVRVLKSELIGHDTRVSKGNFMIDSSTSHTPYMAGRG